MILDTERFFLRPLEIKDANERYLSWLNDSITNKFLVNAQQKEILALSNYVKEKSQSKNILFLGIFEKHTGLHIGNIKYEPIDSLNNYAIMGIMIGDKSWRGKGVAGEVIYATAHWLFFNRGVNLILLGVALDNFAAIRAYEKIGFEKAETIFINFSDPNFISMCWDINKMFSNNIYYAEIS